MQHMIDLLGKQVSFVHTIQVDKKIIFREEKGIVTNVLLDVDGKHEISLDEGDFFPISELLEFEIAKS